MTCARPPKESSRVFSWPKLPGPHSGQVASYAKAERWGGRSDAASVTATPKEALLDQEAYQTQQVPLALKQGGSPAQPSLLQLRCTVGFPLHKGRKELPNSSALALCSALAGYAHMLHLPVSKLCHSFLSNVLGQTVVKFYLVLLYL